MTNGRPNFSTQLRNPSLDLNSDDRQKIYTAAIERRIILLTIRDIQMRSVCEAATGVPYDSFDPSEMSYEDILEEVVQDMSRGLGLAVSEARDIVARNRQTANPTLIEGNKTLKTRSDESQTIARPQDYESQLREFNDKTRTEI